MYQMSAFPASLSLESSGHCGIFPVMEGDVAICGEAPGVPEPGDGDPQTLLLSLGTLYPSPRGGGPAAMLTRGI